MMLTARGKLVLDVLLLLGLIIALAAILRMMVA